MSVRVRRQQFDPFRLDLGCRDGAGVLVPYRAVTNDAIAIPSANQD